MTLFAAVGCEELKRGNFMEKKSIKLKTRFLISVLLGIVALIIGFSVSMSEPSGDTPEKIKEVETAIKNMCQDIGKEQKIKFDDGAIVDVICAGPTWEKIEEITNSLVYANQKIAKAKALLYYQVNPIPEIFSWDKYLWESRNEISKEDWAIQTLNSRISISIGIAALSCLGCIIGVFLLLIIVNWLWYFLLHRISELSQAVQGK